MAINPHDLSWKYNRIDPHGIEWSCWCEVWYTISRVGSCKFWDEAGKFTGLIEGDCGVWMVWDTDMDRRICNVPDDAIVVACIGNIA